MSDFSDRPFVAGTITGIRSFRIDKFGRLTGVSKRKVWLPGENNAECLRAARGGLISSFSFAPNLSNTDPVTGAVIGCNCGSCTKLNQQAQGQGLQYRNGYPARYVEPFLQVETEEAKHRAADLKCECGYYAYFDGGSNPYHYKKTGEPQIHGVIEAYGLVTVGSRGFRAEKAVIKAVVVRPSRTQEYPIQLVQRNYPDVAVYPSQGEALAAFPLTPPPVPTPDTDDDFWTRAS